MGIDGEEAFELVRVLPSGGHRKAEFKFAEKVRIHRSTRLLYQFILIFAFERCGWISLKQENDIDKLTPMAYEQKLLYGGAIL